MNIKIGVEYKIDTYSKLNKFMEELGRIISDKRIKGIYTDGCINIFNNSSIVEKLYLIDGHIYIVFNNYILKILYNFYSIVYITILEANNFNFDDVYDIKLDVSEKTINNYELEYFTEEYEINSSTGETRPSGGEYFKKISLYLNNDKLCFCAEDSIHDGYCNVWIEK